MQHSEKQEETELIELACQEAQLQRELDLLLLCKNNNNNTSLWVELSLLQHW